MDSNIAESSEKQPGKIIRKPGAKAPVWQFFRIRNQIKNNSAVRSICGDEVLTKGEKTSCMISHIKSHHSSQHEEIHESKRKSSSSNSELASSSKCARIEHNYFNISEANFVNSNLDFDLDTLSKSR